MALTPLVLMDAKTYLDSVDLTGFSNKISLAAKQVNLDDTTFASGGWVQRVGGVFDGDAGVDGFYQAGDLTMPDDVFWADLGNANAPLTAVPTGGVAGDLAYLTRVLECDYRLGGKHGELLSYTMGAKTNWPIARGKILHPQGTARTVTGNGTGFQLGAVDTSHAMYVNLHILGYTDGNITVTIQDSIDNTFGAPHTSGTFTVASALGGQTMKIAGAITNTWWRAIWTIAGGATHSFLFAISAGIGPK